MTQTLRIGVVQTTTGINPAANARALVAALEQAKAGGAEIAFTPEMSGLLDRDRRRIFETAASEAEDIVLATVCETAARLGLWVHLGSLALKPAADADRLVNRGFVIDGTGAIRARYDKMHLFDVDLPTGERYRESATYVPGEQAVVTDTPWGRLGLSICYDLRFPRLYETLSGAGATILSVPAAFTRPTGKAHWHTLLTARAIEAAAFVVAAAQTGVHEDGRETFGHSLVIDPWGTVLHDGGEAPGVACVDLDLGAIETARGRIPVIAHRRDIRLAGVE